MIVLSGILVMIIGLVLRINTLLVILAAGFVTGFTAGMSVTDIVSAIGQAFLRNRYMTLFVLVLPVVGLLEHYGLRERAEILISRIKGATAGRILLLYMFLRQATNAVGLQVGGHPSFIRPLISPMAEAAALRGRTVPPETTDKIKAMAASSENFGNFFGQNLFIAAGGLLLIKGVMEQAGYEIDLGTMAQYALPTAITAFILAFIRFSLFDRSIEKEVSAVMTGSDNVVAAAEKLEAAAAEKADAGAERSEAAAKASSEASANKKAGGSEQEVHHD